MSKKIKCKIDNLNIIIYDENKLKEKYKKERLEFINHKEVFIPWGFFQDDYYKKDPRVWEAEWNSRFPDGFQSWNIKYSDKLTGFWQQLIIDKLNEIINFINK